MNDDAPAKASSTHVADQVDVLRYATDEWKPMNDCRTVQRDRGRGMRARRGNGSLDMGSSLRLVFILEWEIAYGSWIEKPVVPRKGVPVLGHFVSLLEVRVDAKRVSTGTQASPTSTRASPTSTVASPTSTG